MEKGGGEEEGRKGRLGGGGGRKSKGAETHGADSKLNELAATV